MNKVTKHFRLLLLVILIISCENDDSNKIVLPENVLSIANSNLDFTILAEALNKTNMIETLQEAGPFTVFAPTNQAFQDLLNSRPDWNTLDDIPIDSLRLILKNHIIDNEVLAEASFTSAVSGYKNTLANGPTADFISLYFNTEGSVVELNGGDQHPVGATIINPNNFAKNGVVHGINKVLQLPTIMDHVEANQNFSTLLEALTSATPNTNFEVTLATPFGTNPAPFTLFVPKNGAFESYLSQEPTINSVADINEETLKSILEYHVLLSNVRYSVLTPNDSTIATTLQGGTIEIILPGSNNLADIMDATGNKSQILQIDIQAANGVIHIVNGVLMPDLN